MRPAAELGEGGLDEEVGSDERPVEVDDKGPTR
jgi:hypothetical protein